MSYKDKEKQREYDREYNANNKEKKREYNREYRTNNKDKAREYMREYRAENKDKVREYRANNKDNIREYKREYEKDRRKADPAFRAINNARARGAKILKSVGKPKTRRVGSFEKYFGCSEDTYLAHISAQFKDGMTFENQGAVWELDHCIPMAVVYEMPLEDLESNILMLNHFTNLQPLLIAENRAKGDTLPDSLPPNFPFWTHFLFLFEDAA